MQSSLLRRGERSRLAFVLGDDLALLPRREREDV